MIRSAFFALLLALSAQHSYASAYDDVIQRDRPVLYLPLSGATKPKNLKHTKMPNGDLAVSFNGLDEYVEIPSHPNLSVSKTGILSIEAWIRPGTLEFSKSESDGYVHWAGKGEGDKQEYALRFYSKTNTATPTRANRISAYAFNPNGGLGSGSYFQETLDTKTWIHVAAIINTKAKSEKFPSGYVRIYRDGVLKDTTGLDQFQVVPVAGPSPLRLGTRDFRSYFKGAIGKFAVYNYELSAEKIRIHRRSLTP